MPILDVVIAEDHSVSGVRDRASLAARLNHKTWPEPQGEEMAETSNIAVVANKISFDIFRVFHWEIHPQRDTNFDCVIEDHTSDAGKAKNTHPADAIFYYLDPYLKKRIYLHTDLKSYKKSTIQVGKIREALRSLAMTCECAHLSESWSKKFLPDDSVPYEIRGLLFVANHDGKAVGDFSSLIRRISRTHLPVAKNQILHVLGPDQITRLYAIATDIRLLKESKGISDRYRFYYPDLTLWKRQTTDDERTAATVETLLSPYFILTHDETKDEQGSTVERAGSIVYYARDGGSVEEFVYLLDSLLRYQLVKSTNQIRVRMTSTSRDQHFKNNFLKAKNKYCEDWGFEGSREAEIHGISIDAIQPNSHNYCPDEIGWDRT